MPISFNQSPRMLGKYTAANNNGTEPYRRPEDEEHSQLAQMVALLPDLSIGNEPKQIYSMQKAFNTLDYTGKDNNPLKIDGIWGENSRHSSISAGFLPPPFKCPGIGGKK